MRDLDTAALAVNGTAAEPLERPAEPLLMPSPSPPAPGSQPPPSVARGPRAPERTAWVDVCDEYPDFRMRVRLNYRREWMDDVFRTAGMSVESPEQRTEREARRLLALHRIVLDHNGWCDEDGEPYPAASDDTFWDAIPEELAGAMLIRLRLEATALPSSLARTGKPSSSG